MVAEQRVAESERNVSVNVVGDVRMAKESNGILGIGFKTKRGEEEEEEKVKNAFRNASFIVLDSSSTLVGLAHCLFVFFFFILYLYMCDFDRSLLLF